MTGSKLLLILGTSAWAEEVADVARDAGFEVAGFVEHLNADLAGTALDGLPVHWIDDVAPLAAGHLAITGLGTTNRQALSDRVGQMGFRFATIVHPHAQVSSSATLGPGCFVNAGAVVGTKVKLGKHVILNRGALVGHHTEIGDYCSIKPGANIGGACCIEAHTWVGIGSTIIERLTVGEGSVIAAGAVVTKDVPPSTLVMGVPAKVVEEDIAPR